MLKVNFLVVYVKRNNICTYTSQDTCLKDLEVTFTALRNICEIEIPSPSNCVSFLKFEDSRQHITLGKKIIVASVEGFKLRS